MAEASFVKAVISDLDGTLIDLPINYQRLYERLNKIFGMSGVVPLRVIESEIKGKSKLRRDVFKVMDEEEFEAVPKMVVKREIVELLKGFQTEGKRLTLVTMQGRKVVRPILNRLGLSFSAVITREDSLDREKQIRLAVKKLAVRPEDVLVIGDRLNDEASAKRAGCKFMSVKRPSK